MGVERVHPRLGAVLYREVSSARLLRIKPLWTNLGHDLSTHSFSGGLRSRGFTKVNCVGEALHVQFLLGNWFWSGSSLVNHVAPERLVPKERDNDCWLSE